MGGGVGGGVAGGVAGGAAGEAGVETGSGVSSAMRAAVLLQSWTGSAGSGRDEMDKGTERAQRPCGVCRATLWCIFL